MDLPKKKKPKEIKKKKKKKIKLPLDDLTSLPSHDEYGDEFH